MSVSYNGFHSNVITIPYDTTKSLKPGMPVTINETGLCKPAQMSNFIGVCVGIREGNAAVQVSGYVEAKANTDALPYGVIDLFVDNDCNVSAHLEIAPGDVLENAKAYSVLKVDSENNIVGFIL